MDQELLYRRKRKKPRRFKEQVNPKIAGSLRAAEGIAGFKSVVLACFCKQNGDAISLLAFGINALLRLSGHEPYGNVIRHSERLAERAPAGINQISSSPCFSQ
jgi:hypothetical protein